MVPFPSARIRMGVGVTILSVGVVSSCRFSAAIRLSSRIGQKEMLLNGFDNPGSQILIDIDIGHGGDDPHLSKPRD